jgi:hypothetical protein
MEKWCSLELDEIRGTLFQTNPYLTIQIDGLSLRCWHTHVILLGYIESQHHSVHAAFRLRFTGYKFKQAVALLKFMNPSDGFGS